MNLEIFLEKYDYTSPGFVTRIEKAVMHAAGVNFLFNKQSDPGILCRISDEIRKHGTIPEVVVTLCKPQEETHQIAGFTGLSSATYFNIGNFAVQSLEGVQHFPLLNRVSIGYMTEKDMDFSPLEQCRHLETLSVERRLTKRQNQMLCNLPALKRLRVHGLNIRNTGVMPSLTFLEVHGLLQPEQMSGKFPNLKELVIISSKGLTDLDFLTGMVQLEELRILGPMGGITALPDFSRNKLLTSVYLRDMKHLCNVDHLQSLPQLKLLRLGGNINLVPDALPWFRRATFPCLDTLRLDLKSGTTAKALEAAFHS